MKNFLLTVAIFLLLFCFLKPANACHAYFGDLSYTCINDSTIQLDFEYYYNCICVVRPDTLIIYAKSDTCGVRDTLTAFKTNMNCVRNIDFTCNDPNIIGSCQCNGSPMGLPINLPPLPLPHVYPSFEVDHFRATYVLPKNASGNFICCPDLTFFTSLSPRVSGSNINNVPGGDGFVVAGSLSTCNLTTPCNNSSPHFFNNAIMTTCTNQPFIYSGGGSDAPENHWLTYSLVPALGSENIPLAYNPPLSYDQPLITNPPLSLKMDSLTGNITGTLSSLQSGTVAYLVTEYDVFGNVVGVVLKEVIIIVENCDTLENIPVDSLQITSVNNGNRIGEYEYEAQCGATMTIDFTIQDPNTTDTLVLTHNLAQSIPGATLVCTGSGNIQNCQLTSVPDTTYSVKYVTFDLHDDICPLSTYQSITIRLTNSCTPPVSTIKNNETQNFTVYPNPVRNILHFDVTQFERNLNDTDIRIYDLTGKSYNTTMVTDGRSATIDMKALPTGIFYIEVSSDNKSYISKVVKM